MPVAVSRQQRSTCSRGAADDACRLRPRFARYRSRLAFWLWVSGSSSCSACSARGRTGQRARSHPRAPLAGDWPRQGVLALSVLCSAGWLVTRERLDPAPGDHGGRGARRPHRSASCARRIVATRRRDQSVRAPVPPAVAPRLAVAPAGPGRADGRQAGSSRCRLRRACATPRLIRACGSAWAGTRSGISRELRRSATYPSWSCRSWSSGWQAPGSSLLSPRALRAVPGSGRTAAQRAAAASRARNRPHVAWQPPPSTGRSAGSVGGLVRRPASSPRHSARGRGSLDAGLGTAVWQWQDPFTALYTKWKQHQLAAQYDKRVQSFEKTTTGPRPRRPSERASRARQAVPLELEARSGDRPDTRPANGR